MPPNFNQKYQQAAEEFARRVTATLGDQVDAIVLYGSVARGEARRDSDIDILVVSPDPKVVWTQASEICSDFTFEVKYTFFISLVHLSREELEWHVRVRSPFTIMYLRTAWYYMTTGPSPEYVNSQLQLADEALDDPNAVQRTVKLRRNQNYEVKSSD